MTSIPDKRFHDGHSIPAFGLGIWEVSQDDATRVVRESLELGYRLIDGAILYGNEAELGEGLRQSGVDRDEVFITSKVWNAGMGYDDVRKAVDESLNRIGIDKLNLMLLHWPFPGNGDYVDCWKALIDAQKDGQMTSIGTSNFHEEHLKRIIDETGVTPVLNQLETNPKNQQAEMRRVDDAHDIVTQSWSPLGNARSFDAEPIKAVCERTGKSAPQVILRWHIDIGNAVITRSTKKDHLAANMDIFDFELTKDEIAAIEALHTGERTGPNPDEFQGH